LTTRLASSLVAAAILFGAHAANAACLTNLDCTTATAPICDPVTHACRACQVSDAAIVSECAVKNPSKPLCAASGALAGQCVGCLSSSDCSGTADRPTCDVTTGVCAPCQNDYSASNPQVLSCTDPNKPACQKVGEPLNGQCAECSKTNTSACLTKPGAPACNEGPLVGGRCGCTQDGDCGTKSGLVCDGTKPPGGLCEPGCRASGGNDSCPTGKTCSKQDGTIGQCSGNPTCTKDADCTQAPNVKCDTSVTPGQCVQCLADGDCSGGNVCETNKSSTKYGMCVPCTPTKDAGCKSSAGGSVCLAATDTCGCLDDVNCGSTTSGRVCEGTSHACEDGCRGKGGNGCPAGVSCSSTDTSIGTCGGGDGGVVDGGDAGGGGDGGGGDGGGAGSSNDGSIDGSALGEAPPGIVEGGGCACGSTTGALGSPAGFALGLVVALCAWVRRRRA
jgi:MYXO-CTERM domain-containing protein